MGRRGRGIIAAALAVVTAAVTVLPAAASPYEPPTLPWANCSGNIAAMSSVIEAHRQPADGARVIAGAPLVLSAGFSHLPLTFAITTSPPPSTPLDVGTPGADAEGIVAFSSPLAGATPGTVYWTLSYPTSAIPECAGLGPPITPTVTLPVWSVEVLAPNPGQPPPQPSAPLCKVPRLRGTSLRQARLLLKRAGCRLGRVTRRGSGRATYRITGQSPRAGARRAANATVSVTLSAPSRHRS